MFLITEAWTLLIDSDVYFLLVLLLSYKTIVYKSI